MADEKNRAIVAEVVIAVDLEAVWRAWTTEEGLTSFLAPKVNIELRPMGRFEPLFDLDREPGKQGAEGMFILAVAPMMMLSFTWNAPPHLKEARGQMTHVCVHFLRQGEGTTKVRLVHDGWGEGGEWDEAYDYFDRAWKQVVMPRLKEALEKGPIDWEKA